MTETVMQKKAALADSLLDLLGWLSLIVVGTPLHLAANGFVLLKLWAWFVVPLGVVPITFWHAVGIDCVFTFVVLAAIPAPPKDAGIATTWARLINRIAQAGVLLVLGAFVHWMAR